MLHGYNIMHFNLQNTYVCYLIRLSSRKMIFQSYAFLLDMSNSLKLWIFLQAFDASFNYYQETLLAICPNLLALSILISLIAIFPFRLRSIIVISCSSDDNLYIHNGLRHPKSSVVWNWSNEHIWQKYPVVLVVVKWWRKEGGDGCGKKGWWLGEKEHCFCCYNWHSDTNCCAQ